MALPDGLVPAKGEPYDRKDEMTTTPQPEDLLDRVVTVLHETPGERPLRFVTASEFAAVSEAASEALVADAESGAVIPANGLVLVYGDGGAGKTTLVLDLLVHLAAGKPWLDLVSPVRALRIALIENEGPRAMFRDKLAHKLEAWPEAGERILVLEEPWQGVTFRDEPQRDELVRLVASEELDLLVAAPLSRLGMQGGGTLDEIGEFAALVADVQRRCERPLTVLLVHHENRAGQVSGAWEGFPDTLVHVQAQGHGRTRVYWKKLRWSSLLHGTTTHLLWAEGESFEVQEREEITEATMADAILAAVFEFPGGSWRQIREQVRGNATEAAAIRDRLLSDGLIVNRAARDGQFNLWRADDPAVPGSELRTALEPLWGASPEGAREVDRFPVPPYREPGNRNHPREPGPLIGEAGYLEDLFAALEAGHITEAEWRQGERAHRFVIEVGP
jgi:hypothetical protein